MHRDKVPLPTDVIVNEVLLCLQDRLDREGLDLNKDFGLPTPHPVSTEQRATPRVILEETSYDTSFLQGKVTEQFKTLNLQQR